MTTTPGGVSIERLAQMIERGDVQGVSDALRADPSLVSARTASGDNPLHLACWYKQVAIIGSLLAFRADVNARGCYGRTPLHYAVHEGHAISIPIVGTLLGFGADPSLRDENGFTVEDWAKIEMSEGLAGVLEQLRRPRPAAAVTRSDR